MNDSVGSGSCNTTGAAPQSSAMADQCRDFEPDDNGGHQIRAPDVQGVSAHGEKFGNTTPLHDPFLSNDELTTEAQRHRDIEKTRWKNNSRGTKALNTCSNLLFSAIVLVRRH